MNDLLFAQGKDNLAGLIDFAYICPSEDVLSVPDLAAATSLKTAAAAIVCKTGKQFHKIYFTDETAKVEIKSVGQRDGKGRETTLAGRYPKLGTALEDAIRLYQNTPSVIIYRLAADGKLYIMGVTQMDQTNVDLALTIPAYFETGDTGSGEKRADQNGGVLTWKFGAAHGPIEYAQTIDSLLVPGS